MNYDFSFSPRAFWGTAICLVTLLLATFLAGFVIGTIREAHRHPALVQAHPILSRAHASPTVATPTASAPENSSTTPSPSTSSAQAQTKHYCLQFGIFKDKGPADQLVKDLSGKGVTATETTKEDQYEQTWLVIRAGDFSSFEDASQAADGLRPKLSQPVLVRPSDSL